MVTPGGEDRFFENTLGGFGEEDMGAAFAAPGAVDGLEGSGVGLDEIFLLERSQFDHCELFAGVSEGGEDFSCHTEVGVVHVFSFLGLRQAEGEAAEVGGSGRHEALLRKNIRARVECCDKQEQEISHAAMSGYATKGAGLKPGATQERAKEENADGLRPGRGYNPGTDGTTGRHETWEL